MVIFQNKLTIFVFNQIIFPYQKKKKGILIKEYPLIF